MASFLGAMNWINGVGVRPECTRICRDPKEGTRRAAVTGFSFLGSQTNIEVRLDTGEAVLAEIASDHAAFIPGETVYIRWDPKDEIRFETQ